ncbi:hypothetical protein HerbRD11066_17800 [Herbidospora sp. RD11066]
MLWKPGFGLGLAAALAVCVMSRHAFVRCPALPVWTRSWDVMWRLSRFLLWACDANLLRVAGSAYRFRHRDLRDRLVHGAYRA